MASDLVKRQVLPRAGRRTYAQCSGGHIGEVKEGSAGGTWKCECGVINSTHTDHAVQFIPFMHEHLGHEPVLVDSWKTYRNVLRQNNWHNELAD
jgi:hypothetical protein